MNVWRWLGISIFVLGTVCLIGSTKYSAYGQEDKTKKTPPVEDKTKKVDPKVEPKGVEAPKAGDKLVFSAFEKGAKSFFQEQKTKTKQEMKVMSQVVVQTQEQTFLIEWTPKDKDAKGNYVVTQKIVGVKMEINIGGNKISYDSTSAVKTKNPMTDFFEQLTKQELTFTISPDMQTVVSIDTEQQKNFIKGLSDINPQMQTLLKAILSENALKKMAEPTWYAFPKDGAYPKEPWKRDSDLDLGPIGKYKTDFTFKLNKSEGTKDIIGITTKLEYKAPEAAAKAGLPFIIHEAKLDATEGTGTTTFDRTKGRFDSTELTMKLKGQLTIEVGSTKTIVELDQTQTATSTTFDGPDRPAAWKAAK